MRRELRILLCAALLAIVAMLAGCGSPGIERMDVTWLTDPPPRWALYPGYRQEIPCPKGAVYRVEAHSQGAIIAGGAIAALPGGLAFRPLPGSRGIDAEALDETHLVVYVTLRDSDGQSRRLLALRVEHRDDKIYFEFPK